MNDQQRIDEWLLRLQEGTLGETDREALRRLLRESPEALDRYLDHCEIETWLAAAGGLGMKSGSLETTSVVASVSEPKKRKRRAFFAAAACLVLGAIAWIAFQSGGDSSSPPDPVVVKMEPETTFDGSRASVSDEPNALDLVGDVNRGRDPWKVINATGSAQHPGLKDKPIPAVVSDRPIQFNRDIRPILSETCFHCHGPDEHGRRADLRLDSIEGATADLGGTVAIVPGDLEKSEAWWRIISDDPDELMPPPESHLVLSMEQKALLMRWIEEGAEYEGHWAYETPTRPEVPESKWGNNEIDAFIARRLAEDGMQPSMEASPRALIRRLTFDLTGLPPTKNEVDQFVSAYASDPEATWEATIDRLLASPHFGERMALPWLDQARYADTNGYSIDGGRDMWLWRDWVIQAYNENKPFDQFTVEQIAGDLLRDATPSQIVATGFNRNHMITHEGGTIPEENLTNYTADRVKTTSEVFLGLTMACAQCHDHKYDPISIKEYYEFFSFFNELSDRGLDGNAGVNAKPSIMAKTSLPTGELESLRAELAAVTKHFETSTEGFDAWVAEVREEEKRRGEGFQIHPVTMLDASAPNRPGIFEFREDGAVIVTEPNLRGGRNSFSHALRLPGGAPIQGIRIHFVPQESDGRLSPFDPDAPMVTTVLASSGNQIAKQVEFYNQLTISRATASSAVGGHEAKNILDERNLHWWRPKADDRNPYLTVSFDEPIDPSVDPHLAVLVFFGVSEARPFQWKMEAFSGLDSDSRFSLEVQSLLAKAPKDWTPEERSLALETFRSDAEILEPTRIRLANLQERIDILTEEHSTLVMDTAPKPRETFVLDRGQYDAPTEKVDPATPSVLPALDVEERATRLDLAHWMVDPENPLTARVAVNRIWQVFFGTGIVSTTADFGSQGEWPSHPDLIDWLATEFVESGWDQKALVREIVSSATYRQNSAATAEQRERDPDNRLLGRGPRFRLAAEFIRDQMLAKSGLLVPRIGGPSVQPYQPAGLWKEVSHFGSTPATKQVFVQDRGEKLYRRSLYTIVKRTSPHPSMAAFDAPNREMCITERGVTNTPLQALVTLNDPQFAEASRVFAARLLDETSDVDERERLSLAFEKVTGRPPRDSEVNALGSFLTDERSRYESDEAATRALIAVGEYPVNDSHPAVEQAVWTQVSALLFNLSESLTRL